MRYKSHRYKFDLREIISEDSLQDEDFIGEILGWLYTNLTVGNFRYNHSEGVVRFNKREDRIAFKLRWL